jgi:hypothetical protein
MSKPLHDFQLPVLEEHRFRSNTPVFGSFIAWIRSMAYNIAARWGVQAVIARQNQINALFVAQLQDMARYLEDLTRHLEDLGTRLQEYEERLIDQDRDLTLLARTLAEVDLRQRYLAKSLTRQEQLKETDPTGRDNAA